MKDDGKYQTSSRDGFEPGSNNTVLKNKLGIIDLHEMEYMETVALKNVHERLIDEYGAEHLFSADDLCYMHKAWLGHIYEWAGEYRSVNMSKGDFTFAAAHLIPHLMKSFEREELSKYTPCNEKNLFELIQSVAVIHVEYILIHPFREGNGRLGRLLASLMSLQANYPPLDYGFIAKEPNREVYFAAVRAGLDRNYEPMKGIFHSIIKATLASSSD